MRCLLPTSFMLWQDKSVQFEGVPKHLLKIRLILGDATEPAVVMPPQQASGIEVKDLLTAVAVDGGGVGGFQAPPGFACPSLGAISSCARRHADTLQPKRPVNQRENALSDEKPSNSATSDSALVRFPT